MSDPVVQKQDELAAAYLRVFDPGFSEGQVVLDEILESAGLLEQGSAEDTPTSFAWRAGRRSLAVHIINRMSMSPGELSLRRRQQVVRSLYGRPFAEDYS